MTALVRRAAPTLLLLALGAALMILAVQIGVRIAGAQPIDAGAVTVEPLVDAGVTAPAVAPISDPTTAPLESASEVWTLYKAGHLVPAIVLGLFFLLTLLQKWIAWLRTGYRKLVTAAVLAALGMLAERAAVGETPNLTMLAGAIGVALALYVRGDGEAKGA